MDTDPMIQMALLAAAFNAFCDRRRRSNTGRAYSQLLAMPALTE